MAYRRSEPLLAWCGPRRRAVDALAAAHAAMPSRPLAHAYVLRVVAEFQAFTRDLHDLAADRLVNLSGPDLQHGPSLVAAATEGRWIDRGNADLRNLTADFARLGVRDLSDRIRDNDPRWSGRPGRGGDRTGYRDLIRIRNCLAHGNQRQLDDLRREGVLDTLSWTRARLPVLDRMARALDRAVWDHLLEKFGTEPW